VRRVLGNFSEPTILCVVYTVSVYLGISRIHRNDSHKLSTCGNGLRLDHVKSIEELFKHFFILMLRLSIGYSYKFFMELLRDT
jgi:hypothetical protein